MNVLRRLYARLSEPATRTDIAIMAIAIVALVFVLAAFGVGQP